jgi:predicted PurR-regulated permease PerM
MNEVVIARSTTVLAVLGVIATMYFAKAVFLPLALAILLTFLLAPAVRLLRSWGLPKPPAVVLVVAFAFTVIVGIGVLVGQQVTKLASTLLRIGSRLGLQRRARDVTPDPLQYAREQNDEHHRRRA